MLERIKERKHFFTAPEEKSNLQVFLNILAIVLQVVIIVLLIVDIVKRKKEAEDEWEWDWDEDDDDFLYVTDEDDWEDEDLEEDTHHIRRKIRQAESRLKNLKNNLPEKDIIIPMDEKVVFELDEDDNEEVIES